MITPRNEVGSSPDDDPTGVRALLSSLPDPGPMPAYLVERISASLAAEQDQRADRFSGSSVTPMLSSRRRLGRLLFAVASAAAAVTLLGVVGNNMFRPNVYTAARESSAAAITSDTRTAQGAAPQADVPPRASDNKAAQGGSAAPAFVQVRSSETRYTLSGFATQVRSLRSITLAPARGETSYSVDSGKIGTAAGLHECLVAIGAGRAQMVRADLAYYEGHPAVIIVATKDGIPTAYAVGRGCSASDAALLHPGMTLP